MTRIKTIKQPPKVQAWEPHFDLGAVAYEFPEAVRELRVCPERRWRFDRAYPAYRVGVEVNGGVWEGGRHTRGQGFINDREKINHAQILGWIVLEFTPQQVISGYCWDTIESALRARGWKGEP